MAYKLIIKLLDIAEVIRSKTDMELLAAFFFKS